MCAEDVNFTANASAISAEWARAADEESAIAGAVWAAGAWPGDDSMVAWRPVIDVRASKGIAATTGGASGANDTRNSTWVLAAVAPGILQHNSFYVVTVKVRNGAGLWATAHSDGVRVDLTPPVVHKVLSLDPTQPIGVIKETAVQVATNMASVAVHAGDPESGLLEWHYGIGSRQGEADIRAFVALPLNSTNSQPATHGIGPKGGLELTPGGKYYHVVRAVNRAGLVSGVVSSEPFVVGRSTSVAPALSSQLFFDPFPMGAQAPAVSMVANISVGSVLATGEWRGVPANVTTATARPVSISGTVMQYAGYNRWLDTGAALPTQPVELQLLYSDNSSIADALSMDADPWLMYYTVSESARRLRQLDETTLAGRPGLLAEGWHPVESTCLDTKKATRRVNYATRVLSSHVCLGGMVALFTQRRPSVAMPADIVLQAHESRVLPLSANPRDADGHVAAVLWTWTSTVPPYATRLSVDNASAVAAIAGPLLEGTTTFTLTVTDNVGASSFANFSVTVLPFYEQGEVV